MGHITKPRYSNPRPSGFQRLFSSEGRFNLTRDARFRRSAAVRWAGSSRSPPPRSPTSSSAASSSTPRSPSCRRRRPRARTAMAQPVWRSGADRRPPGVGEHPPAVRGDLPILLRLARERTRSPATRRRLGCGRDRCLRSAPRPRRRPRRSAGGAGDLARVYVDDPRALPRPRPFSGGRWRADPAA